ncbi:MAG: DEAD/DEAH box helicase family protein [Bradymonadaceae bacterium]|nr:DEAD/DEAH box helicase family protein [Lujinxingiaceae bacterium]
MNKPGMLEVIRATYTALMSFVWTTFARALDLMRNLGAFRGAMIIITILGLVYLVSRLMQRRLVKKLDKTPDEPVAIWFQELLYSVPGIAIFVVTLPARLIGAALNAVSKVLTKKKAGEEDKKDEPKPVLVASLGPSFLWAGLITAGIYLLCLLAEPLIRLHLGAPAHFPAWQYVIYGHRPELAWYLPLENFPYLAGLVATVLWFSIWWWVGRFVRLFYGEDLGRNLVKERENLGVLAAWRDWFATTNLVEIDHSYREWAQWLPLVAIPFLLWSWVSIGGDPYRVSASMFAVTLVLWASWALHIKLEGFARLGDEEKEEATERAPVEAKGWFDVVADLEGRLNVAKPTVSRAPRPVDPLPFTRLDQRSAGVVSPLLVDILPEPKRLTYMQHAVLTSISMAAYVHTEPPTVERSLRLDGPAASGIENRETMRHRNQIVLAPEGAGKSTLVALAACNHALVHTRATLVVARDSEAADAIYDAIQAAVTPSTLRWNIRARRVGGDLVNDLAQGIIPDVIVCSLQQLVVNMLDNSVVYAPFLENLGLIVVDDIESFSGPVEIHAQLAFRRLILRVRELLSVRQLGEEHAPMMLVLGADMMHDMPTWARSLCGIDAVARHFSHSNTEAEEREAAQSARQSVAGKPSTKFLADEPDQEVDQNTLGRHQLFYRLSDFRTAMGEHLDVRDLIESCERLAIPWHYRPCGDERRRLGRQMLAMRDEPRYHTEQPAQACVVFLHGHFSAVNRELERLSRAGAEFSSIEYAGEPGGSTQAKKDATRRPEPIAMITLVDPDEEMALTELNERSSLANELRDLPRPVVRPPSGAIVDRHLASDLVNHWMEVADVLEVFGNPTAITLHELAQAGVLLSEARTDVDAQAHDYEDRLFVRALSRAVESPDSREDAQHAQLPPRVMQVEIASGRNSAVRDRTNLSVIRQVDTDSARHVYYPGRIFETAQGRFIVVGQARSSDSEANQAVVEGDIFVEPFLNDDVSSPRRRTRLRITASAQGDAFFGPEPMLIGEYPIAVGLCSASCTTEHIATYRLGPNFGEVRQRIFYGQDARDATFNGALETAALVIFPNPELPFRDGEPAPRLTLDDARLVAAAMRAVLASMYRGAETGIELAIHVQEAAPGPEYVLTSTDAFFLYDLHSGGNGTARAIHRDGVELLLRLARLYLERVLYHDRLRSRYDHWGDEGELVGQRANRRGADEAEKGAAREARARALTWLDSRLRPEGSTQAGKLVGHYGSGREQGEGDVFDIGRCWFSQDGGVTDLVWCKHRWHFDDGSEAMVDVGFDRKTVAELLGADRRELIDQLQSTLQAQSQNPALGLDDGTIWGAPRTIWTLGPGDEVPLGSEGQLANDPGVRAFQALACATAIASWPALGPLADLLRERGLESALGAGEHEAIEAYIARFVQGIPNAALVASARLRAPIHTLLYRIGESDSQSLLLAMLLKHSGIDAGLFVSMRERRVLTAAAIDAPKGIEAWREAHPKLAESLLMWSDLPARPGATNPVDRLYVPIETVQYQRVATIQTAFPQSWVFVPLNLAWERIGIDDPFAPLEDDQ